MRVELNELKRLYSRLKDSRIKIRFLNDYLEIHKGLEPAITGWVYEKLADLSKNSEAIGEYRKKSGFSYERAAFMESNVGLRSRGIARKALKNSILQYSLAAKSFDNTKYPSLAKKSRERAKEVRAELRRSYGGITRYGSIFVTLASFILTGVFWTSRFTGLVIVEAAPEAEAWLGLGFFVLGLFGMALIVMRESL